MGDYSCEISGQLPRKILHMTMENHGNINNNYSSSNDKLLQEFRLHNDHQFKGNNEDETFCPLNTKFHFNNPLSGGQIHRHVMPVD